MINTRYKKYFDLTGVAGAVVTATASLTNGTAATLLAADSTEFLDLFEVTAACNSTVGATITLSNDGTTMATIVAPANGTAQLRFDPPITQQVKSIAWVADMEDISSTTVTINARFVKRN